MDCKRVCVLDKFHLDAALFVTFVAFHSLYAFFVVGSSLCILLFEELATVDNTICKNTTAAIFA
jgi:hypothetical protein